MTPIQDFDGLVAALVARQGTLSKRHEQVARFCLNHPEDVAINTIVRLAEQAQVPPATITRFAKDLGFAGFAELQRVFRERLLGPRPTYADQLNTVTAQTEVADADLDDPALVFDMFLQAAVGSLLRIGQSLDRGTLNAFVHVIAQAEVVHIAAARGAFGIGAYAFYGLAKVGKRAHLIDNLGAMRVEQVAAIGPKEALVVLTFDDYAPETVAVAQAAYDAGRTVLAITDNELSPVVGLATHVLYVKEARLGHFRSQVPAIVVCQTVIMSVGRRLGMAADFQNPKNEN